jgi:hypothetical protein
MARDKEVTLAVKYKLSISAFIHRIFDEDDVLPDISLYTTLTTLHTSISMHCIAVLHLGQQCIVHREL